MDINMDINIDIIDYSGNKMNTRYIQIYQQKDIHSYIFSSDIVLELDARYGITSCIVNSKLKNKYNHVVVEPYDKLWNVLEENKKRNNGFFHIVKGFITNKKLKLTSSDNWYGTTFIEDNNSTIPCYSFNEIMCKYDLHFNVLIVNSESSLYLFLDEYPEVYNQLKMFIFVLNDFYHSNSNFYYNKIKNKLISKNFINLVEGYQNVWIKKHVSVL